MKMTKLATLFLTATLSLASGAALAADSGGKLLLVNKVGGVYLEEE